MLVTRGLGQTEALLVTNGLGRWLVVTPEVVSFVAVDAGGFERRVAELRRAALLRDDEDLLVIIRAVLDSGIMDERT
jgi:hypothetical protein